MKITSRFLCLSSFLFFFQVIVHAQSQWISSFNSVDTVITSKVIISGSSKYYTAGEIKKASSGKKDIYLFKTDNSGNISWTRTFESPGDKELLNVLCDTGENLFLIGRIRDLSGPVFRGPVFVIKVDANGNTLWSKTYNAGNYTTSAAGFSADGNLIVSCFTNIEYGFLLLKIDVAGGLVWSKQETGTNEQTVIGGICPAKDGGFTVTGWSEINSGGFGAQLFLAHLNEAGTVQWSNTYDYHTEVGQKIAPTRDSCYIIGGYSSGFGLMPRLVKINASGDYVWGKAYPYTSLDMLSSLSVSPDNNIYFSINSANDGSYTYNGSYITKADSTGIVVWQRSAPAFNNKTGIYDIYASNNELVFTAYDSQNKLLLGKAGTGGNFCQDSAYSFSSPSGFTDTKIPLPLTLSSYPVTDSAGLSTLAYTFQNTTVCSEVGIQENNFSKNDVLVFPNPLNNQLTIKTSNSETSELLIYDILSNVVVHKTFESSITINTESLSNGIYFYELRNKKSFSSGKLIKE